MIQDFNKLFLRDLERLKAELDKYPAEEDLWVKPEGINNSAGNLILHLCGNLQHFIGAVLAKNGYDRQRDFEFSGKVSKEELSRQLDMTFSTIKNYFDMSNPNDLEAAYPLEPFGYPMTIHYFLIHLHGHLNYHLGQINYHRRILFEV